MIYTPDLTYGMPITTVASDGSSYDQQIFKEQIIDNNTNTISKKYNSDFWYYIDFGSAPKHIRFIRLYNHYTKRAENGVTPILTSYSDNAVNWTYVDTLNGLKENWCEKQLPASANHQYWRVYISYITGTPDYTFAGECEMMEEMIVDTPAAIATDWSTIPNNGRYDVKPVHISEIRTALNNERTRRGLSAFTEDSDYTLGNPIKSKHIQTTRNYINSVTPVSFSENPLAKSTASSNSHTKVITKTGTQPFEIPLGVTEVDVMLVGGGGGSGGAWYNSQAGSPAAYAHSQLFTASGSFTVPPNVGSITLSAVAGGGGGAGPAARRVLIPGGGGGAGQSIIQQTINVTPGQAISFTIGTAGAGGYNWNDEPANHGTGGGGGNYTIINGIASLIGGGGAGPVNAGYNDDLSHYGPAGTGYPSGSNGVKNGTYGLGGISTFGSLGFGYYGNGGNGGTRAKGYWTTTDEESGAGYWTPSGVDAYGWYTVANGSNGSQGAVLFQWNLMVDVTKEFATNNNFTVPSGVTSLTVLAVGAGGGSGGAWHNGLNEGNPSPPNRWGGDGGNAQVLETTLSVTPGQIIPINIGTRGNNGYCGDAAWSTNNYGNEPGLPGTDGGNTVVGSVVALGGLGGGGADAYGNADGIDASDYSNSGYNGYGIGSNAAFGYGWGIPPATYATGGYAKITYKQLADVAAPNRKGGKGGNAEIVNQTISVIPGKKYNVTVGAGGNNGSYGDALAVRAGQNGTDGGNSNFGDIIISKGGKAGTGGDAYGSSDGIDALDYSTGHSGYGIGSTNAIIGSTATIPTNGYVQISYTEPDNTSNFTPIRKAYLDELRIKVNAMESLPKNNGTISDCYSSCQGLCVGCTGQSS